MNIKTRILATPDFSMKRSSFHALTLKYCYVLSNLWLDECTHNKSKKSLRTPQASI